jgi:hypothetical protein
VPLLGLTRPSSLAEVADAITELAAQITALSEQHPDWAARRNDLRNLILFDADGGYVGFIDFVNGDLTMFGEDD